MNQNACLDLAPKLAASVKVLEAFLADGKAPTEFLVMQARKTCRVLADDLQAAVKEPQSVKAFAPWNGIVRTGPVGSVGTTEGREP